jgi:filamentous hemagglutinin
MHQDRCWIALCAALAVPLRVAAQVIADPTAPANQRPTVLSDSSGRPLVNIQTPSAAGLSRNTYRQFDVPPDGIALNNSATNPWMANGVLAKTILNEVNSNNPSQINGAIAVVGAPAQVIVANPNGIVVNGGSFINATRATLSTGTAQVADGVVRGFDVRGGNVTIAAGGMDNSTTPYTDILSRTVRVLGELRAQDLRVTTGVQTVTYASGEVGALQRAGHDKPGSFAIDTGTLGGMYANHITLIATEAGIGVRNAGTWQASGGQLTVAVNGLLQNRGEIVARTASLVAADGDIVNSGSIQADHAVTLHAAHGVDLFGNGLEQRGDSVIMITTPGNVTLQARGRVGSASRRTGTVRGNQLVIDADGAIRLRDGSSMSASGDVHLRGGAGLSLINARVESTTGNITALGGTGIVLDSSSLDGGDVHLEAGAPFQSRPASLTALGSQLTARQRAKLVATGDIRLAHAMSHMPQVVSGDTMHIAAAGDIVIGPGSTLDAGNDLRVHARRALQLDATPVPIDHSATLAEVHSDASLHLSGDTVEIRGSDVSAALDLTVEAARNLDVSAARPSSPRNSWTLPTFSAGGTMRVAAIDGHLRSEGLMAEAKEISLLANGEIRMSGVVASRKHDVYGVPSQLSASGDVTLRSLDTTGRYSGIEILGASIRAGRKVSVVGGQFARLGSLSAPDLPNGVRSRIDAGNVLVRSRRTALWASDLAATTAPLRNSTSNLDFFGRYRPHAPGSGAIMLRSDGDLDLTDIDASATGPLSAVSVDGQILAERASLTSDDRLTLASGNAQRHTSSSYAGADVFIHNEMFDLIFHNTAVNADFGADVDAGGGLVIDTASKFRATDLVVGQHYAGIKVEPEGSPLIDGSGPGPGRSIGELLMSQFEASERLTIVARHGDLTLNGYVGEAGVGSSKRIYLGDADPALNLIGENVYLRGSFLRTRGAINVVATTGNIQVEALRANQLEGGFNNAYWDFADLVSSSQINLHAARDISISGTHFNTLGELNILSGGNVTLVSSEIKFVADERPAGWFVDERMVWSDELQGDQGIHMGAGGGTLTLSATHLAAAAGTVKLQAAGAIELEAAEQRRLEEREQKGGYTNHFLFFRESVEWTDRYRNEYLRRAPVSVSARDIEIHTGASVNTFGSSLESGRNIAITAADAIHYFAVHDEANETARRDSQSGFGIPNLFEVGTGSGSNQNHQFTLSARPAELQSEQDVLSHSGGDQLLQGTKVSYGGTASFQAGVGEQARAGARLILEGVRNATAQHRTGTRKSVLWQSLSDSGSLRESFAGVKFNGPTGPSLRARGGLQAQIPGGNVKQQLRMLSAQPGMAYLNDLAARSDVDWAPVQLAFEQWNYEYAGLTPAGAALVAAAVAWASGPGGLGLTGGSTTLGGTMADAALTSLSSQATIALINNKGDLGAAMRELASSEIARTTATAALTAGVLNHLGATDAMSRRATGNLADRLSAHAIHSTGRALTQAAVNGGSLDDVLKQAIVGAGVDTLHGEAASLIKGLETDYLTHKLAHALAGYVAGDAAGGHGREGAIGATVGEIVAGTFEKPHMGASADEVRAFDAKVLGYAKLISGTVAAYAGGDAQAAVTSAENAVRNNYLSRAQIQQKYLMLDEATTEAERTRIVADYDALDSRQQRDALACQNRGRGCTNATMVSGLKMTESGLSVPIAGCEMPKRCSRDLLASKQDLERVVSRSGAVTGSYPVETAAAIAVVGPAALATSGLNLSALSARQALTATGIGAAAGGAFDALGQLLGENAYRPAQTGVAMLTGAAAGPFTTHAAFWNALIAGAVNTTNTAVSNQLYGENNSLYDAYLIGAEAGAIGTIGGHLAQGLASRVLPRSIGGAPLKPGVPLLLQDYGHINPYPEAIGEAADQAITNALPLIRSLSGPSNADERT